ncbi:WD repeat-containing protein 19 [Hypsibius exemplaris]|uniref:WD repeat-containing protein 19 n=1 Tax=Hypsibius exemplaris TaxID=2072580 RepID=A0A1W0WGW6_HYPEX|nr:WD repeat-containing protein 19 [Hypsibius exemplaris]
MNALKAHFQFTSDFLREKSKEDLLLQWQPVQANYLVIGSPIENRMLLYDRSHQKITEVTLPAPCAHLAWNRHGMLLALVCPQNGAQVYLWSPVNHRLANQELDTWDSGAVTWMGWSVIADILAIAYSTGNVILLDKASDKRTVVRGHHSGPVMAAAWSEDSLLATCSVVRSSAKENTSASSRFVFVTVAGDTALSARECSYGKVEGIQFATSKFVQGGQREQNTLSCIANENTLVLFNLEDDTRSLQYSFKAEYGKIIQYSWFGDGYILLSFQKGVLIWVSSHPDEQGKELQHLKIFPDKATDMCATGDGARFGICSSNVLKVFQTDLAKMRQKEALVGEGSDLQKLAWTSDGSLIAAVGGNGQGFVFLAKIPETGCAWRDRVAVMVALDTFQVAEIKNPQEPLGVISCNIEPTVVALGPDSFVAAINNLAIFYLADSDSENGAYITLGRYEYLGIIRSVSLTWNLVVVFLTDGRIVTHELPRDNESFVANIEKTISTIGGLQGVSCVALADRNLYFGTSNGAIGFLSLPHQRHELAVQHTAEIVSVFVKEQDALVAFIDSANEVMLYCVTGDVCLKVPGFSGRPMGILFDWVDGPQQTGDFASTFVVYGESAIQVNVFVQHSIFGGILEKVDDATGEREMITKNSALLGFSGGKVAELSNGLLIARTLKIFPQNQPGQTAVDVEKLIKLHRFHEAARLCRKDKLTMQLQQIGQRCVQELDIELAISAYREYGAADKVLLLERYRNVEHLPSLAGHMALIDDKPQLACEWFLRASDHTAALDTYTDLMEWEKAIALAETHAPDKISYARQQHAAQLELLGDNGGALVNYEKALAALQISDSMFERTCKIGIAKISIRMGDLPKGLALCRELRDPLLNEECAGILEEGRHFKDAARMYRDSGNLQKAAAMFLRAKEWKQAEEIIEKTDSMPLRVQLAKVKETAGDFNGAVRLYEAAGENDAVVRLLLESLNRTDLAIEVVDRTRSQEGAKMVAAHFMKMKDFASAIRYLLISGRGEEAFLTAQQYQQMDIFAKVVGDDQPAALYEKIAAFYESRHNTVRSSEYLIQAGQPRRAVDLLLKLLKQPVTMRAESVDEDSALTALVAATVKCNDSGTSDLVSQFLLGNDDGVPKDEKYLLDLYLLSGKFSEADRISLLVADHHLRNGDYHDAHQVLYRTYDRLLQARQSPSGQLWEMFALVHSHAVSTVMYTLKEHDKVARMLIRICRNISKFPKDASRFLLSAVLECTKCQLNKSAVQFALVLMQPEHRAIVTEKYESKILNILRKANRVIDPEETHTECPYASHKFPASLLSCPLCRIRVPFCVLTGMHVIKSDFTLCPGCSMPAIFSEVKSCLQRGLQACPMCAVPWSSDNIRPSTVQQAESYLQRIDFSLNYNTGNTNHTPN